MIEQMLEMIKVYGLEAVAIALIVNILTALIKKPVKVFASKLKDYTKVTRFIVFLPIALGLLLAFCYTKFIQGNFYFNRSFITLWLTSSSLSLTFYAIFEKIFPTKKQLVKENEIKESEKIIEEIKKLIEIIPSKEEITIDRTALEEEIEEGKENEITNKIILRGKSNAKVKAEK